MKRLISQFLSAVLFCPIYAGAASTPSVIGVLNWAVTSLPIRASLPACSFSEAVDCTFATVTGDLTALTITVTSMQNSTGHYSLTGTSTLALTNSRFDTVPLFGTMTETIYTQQDTILRMQFTTGLNTVSCAVSSVNLHGICNTTTNGTSYTKSITLLKN